jgi:hypothetical protein
MLQCTGSQNPFLSALRCHSRRMLPSEHALGLCTPINPVCGGNTTQNPPPSPYLTDRCASSERRPYSWKNFCLRQCGETYRTSGILIVIRFRNCPFASAIRGIFLHCTMKQVRTRIHQVDISTSGSVSGILFDSPLKMSGMATLVSRLSKHVYAPPNSNILWPY